MKELLEDTIAADILETCGFNVYQNPNFKIENASLTTDDLGYYTLDIPGGYRWCFHIVRKSKNVYKIFARLKEKDYDSRKKVILGQLWITKDEVNFEVIYDMNNNCYCAVEDNN